MTRHPKVKVHISPKLKRIEHSHSVRLILFIAAILLSVAILHSLPWHHAGEHGAVATIGLGAVINRGVEVLTDVICDRLFPEMF